MGGIGLVLGAGGATGGAFHGAVLGALAEELGWDARTASIIVGTSAGSVAGATLRGGFPPADMLNRALGRPVSDEGQRLLARAGVPLPFVPPRPQLPRPGRYRPTAPSALVAAARQPFRVRPVAVAAAMLPAGQVDPGIAPLVDGLMPHWPAEPLWICAVDVAVGRRTVFGREGSRAPEATVGQAVSASCAIPGWFQPVSLGGRRFVDGAVHSTTNLDLLAGRGLDLVIVSVPMAGRTAGGAFAGVQVRTESAVVERRGTPVVVFQPSNEDRGAMGFNAMDITRRGKVAEQVQATVRAKLARPEVRERLAVLKPAS